MSVNGKRFRSVDLESMDMSCENDATSSISKDSDTESLSQPEFVILKSSGLINIDKAINEWEQLRSRLKLQHGDLALMLLREYYGLRALISRGDKYEATVSTEDPNIQPHPLSPHQHKNNQRLAAATSVTPTSATPTSATPMSLIRVDAASTSRHHRRTDDDDDLQTYIKLEKLDHIEEREVIAVLHGGDKHSSINIGQSPSLVTDLSVSHYDEPTNHRSRSKTAKQPPQESQLLNEGESKTETKVFPASNKRSFSSYDNYEVYNPRIVTKSPRTIRDIEPEPAARTATLTSISNTSDRWAENCFKTLGDVGEETVYSDMGRDTVYSDLGREAAYPNIDRDIVYPNIGRETLYSDVGGEMTYSDIGVVIPGHAPVDVALGLSTVFGQTDANNIQNALKNTDTAEYTPGKLSATTTHRSGPSIADLARLEHLPDPRLIVATENMPVEFPLHRVEFSASALHYLKKGGKPSWKNHVIDCMFPLIVKFGGMYDSTEAGLPNTSVVKRAAIDALLDKYTKLTEGRNRKVVEREWLTMLRNKFNNTRRAMFEAIRAVDPDRVPKDPGKVAAAIKANEMGRAPVRKSAKNRTFRTSFTRQMGGAGGRYLALPLPHEDENARLLTLKQDLLAQHALSPVDRNMNEIEILLRETYSLRIVEIPTMDATEAVRQWPFTFTCDSLMNDLQQLIPDFNLTSALSILQSLTAPLLELAQDCALKKYGCFSQLHALLEMLEAEDCNKEVEFYVAVCCLPYLVATNRKKEVNSHRYMIDVYPSDVSVEHITADVSSRIHPFIVIQGDPLSLPGNTILIISQGTVLSTTHCLRTAVLSILATYFLFQFEYSPIVKKTLQFLEHKTVKRMKEVPLYVTKQFELIDKIDSGQ